MVNVFHARPGNGTAFARDTFLRIVHFGIDGTPILDMEEKSEILPENKMVTMQIVVSKKAVASPIPTSVPVVPTAAPPATTPPAEVISKKDFIVGKLVYKVTSTSSGKETVQVTKPVKKTNKTITVPATVKYNGKTYKVTTIANKAFQKNVNLQKVTIGKNVTQIGSKAFYGNKKIKSVFIKTKVLKKVGKSAFKNINKKVSFRVPASKKTAYRKFW